MDFFFFFFTKCLGHLRHISELNCVSQFFCNQQPIPPCLCSRLCPSKRTGPGFCPLCSVWRCLKGPPLQLTCERGLHMQTKAGLVLVHTGAALATTTPANNSRLRRAGTAISQHLGLRRCQQRLDVSVILGSHGNPCKPS